MFRVKSQHLVQYCESLRMFVLDRGPETCRWSTAYCRRTCYTKKFLALYPNVRAYLRRMSWAWPHVTADAFTGVGRIRLCRFGEPFASAEDVVRVASWALGAPRTDFWVPTRAWRSPRLRPMLEALQLANLHVLASVDPSTRPRALEGLLNAGWSTMFYGDDHTPMVPGSYRCPAKFEKQAGACGTCRQGCFKPGQVHVWLKKH